ncbi:glycoside hydrolase family 2 protein [Psychroserpens sp. XS_ASV72]|uniref:beta-mannosidase n=1 Tax=Psychroserpens sp. XS_ASV72 TaxID=3241293 RepID=UPI003516B21B
MRISVGFLLLILLLSSCEPKHDLPITINLDDHWEFKSTSDSIWHKATIPGTVHTNLLENKLIEHPFIGDNEHDLQWISETDWEYKSSFNISEDMLQKKHIELNFEGLDTYASIFLNDSLILKTDNAFRNYKIEVKPLLQLENELHIIFERTSIHEEQKQSALPYQLPEGNRIFTRKAQFQYGWDWGPKLNTAGIWKPITLKAWNDYKIKAIDVQQDQLNESIASLTLRLEEDISRNEKLNYDVYVNDSLYSKNLGYPEIPITIEQPKLWWPHNLGEPYLYDIKVVVKDGQKILDSISTKKGLRTVELVTDNDRIGQSFYFKVNNAPVYIKGANYIPQHSLQDQVLKTHYDQLLNDVVAANMNMLRVWGGGIYENEEFYELCDEKGILVWQDFMFACAIYPGDEDFLKNVSIEAQQQVKRLRNHACIALFCGNNESSEGWHRWGWQDGFNDFERDEIWNNYMKVFDSILPQTVEKFSQTDYWESSPKYGRGNSKYKTEGDAHDWWVWHDGYPFEHFEANVPRFMSEFGFQSFPSYEAIRYISQKDSLDISSEGFKNHQKHVRGFQLIKDYMARDFPVPENTEDYVYVSQLLQAYGISKGIEAHRRAKPYNMGTLYWQLNDCWPAVSWSSIDYFGNWKALHYHAKKAFKNTITSSEINDNILSTYIINDNRKGFEDLFSIRIIDFYGNNIWSDEKTVSVSANSSSKIHELDLDTIEVNRENTVVITSIGTQTSYTFLVKPKFLKLTKAPIKQTIQKTENGFSITLQSEVLQKNVFLYTNNKGRFSDNYFDLLPNETLTIDFNTESDILDDLKIKTLNQFIQ